MDLKLNGKRALVTGSSSGIGAGIAKVLAEEGARVVVHGRDREKAQKVADDIQANGGQTILAIGDLSDDAGAAAVAKTVKDEWGGLDILVNNVGGPSDQGSQNWSEVSVDEWIATYNKNVGTAVRMCHQFVDGMKKQGWGRIINISSAIATLPIPTMPDYQCAKAAINNLTVGLSRALAQTGITVNTVTPGPILTPAMTQWLVQTAKQMGWGDDMAEAERRFSTEMIQLDVARLGQPEDVAVMVGLLASPRSGFITGGNIRVDGGTSKSTN